MAADSRAKRGTWPVHSLIYAGIAYIVATIFLLPYIEMIISAVRPANQMLDRDLLPSSFNVESFIDIWTTGFGNNLRISLEVPVARRSSCCWWRFRRRITPPVSVSAAAASSCCWCW